MVTSPRDSINTHSLFHVYISFLPAQKSRWKIFRLIGLQTHSTKWNWSLNTEIQMSGTEIEYGVWENERDGSAYVLLHKSISEDKKPAKSNVFFLYSISLSQFRIALCFTGRVRFFHCYTQLRYRDVDCGRVCVASLRARVTSTHMCEWTEQIFCWFN